VGARYLASRLSLAARYPGPAPIQADRDHRDVKVHRLEPNARNLREPCVAFSRQFLLVRTFHRGLAGSRGAARVPAGCENAAAAARPRRSRPAICPSCPGPGQGVPGADHDHGHFRSYPDRKCPWSWTSTVPGCRL